MWYRKADSQDPNESKSKQPWADKISNAINKAEELANTPRDRLKHDTPYVKYVGRGHGQNASMERWVGEDERPGELQLTDKFFDDHPEIGQGRELLLHELLHDTGIEDIFANDPEYIKLYREGKTGLTWKEIGIGGAINENAVKNLVEYIADPDWLRSKRPEVADYIDKMYPDLLACIDTQERKTPNVV